MTHTLRGAIHKYVICQAASSKSMAGHRLGLTSFPSIFFIFSKPPLDRLELNVIDVVEWL